VEQTSSSLTPWFAVTELKPYISSFAKITENHRKDALQKGANRLLSMQTSDGGLAYWPGGKDSHNWATSYGGNTLMLAKINGAEVPQQAIDGICKYLSTNIHKLISTNKQWDQQSAARALYTLALAGKVKQSDLMHENDSSSAEAKNLVRIEKEDVGKGHWMRFGNSKQLRLFAMCQILPENPETHEIMEEIVSRSTKRNHWGNTWANAATISAMAEYSHVVKNLGDSSFTITINGENEEYTVSAGEPFKKISYNLDKGINIKISSDTQAYANTVVFSKPSIEHSSPISNNQRR